MMHDDRCELAPAEGDYMCRCNVRELQVKLSEASNGKAYEMQKHADTLRKLAAAESRLAALRPLVRAAVEWHEDASNDSCSALDLNVIALDPDLIAWAKGGE